MDSMEGNKDFKVLDQSDVEAMLAKAEETTTTTETQVATQPETVEITTETVETVVDENTENEQSGEKLLQLLTGETTAAATEAVKPEVPKEILNELAKYKEKLTKYEQNAFLKAVVEMGLTPEDTKAIAKEILGTDASNLPIKELLAMDTKNETGLQGDELQEAIDAELDHYESLTPRQKAQFERELKTKYTSSGDSKLLKSILETAPQTQQKLPQEQLDQMVAQDKELLSEAAKGFVGQDIMGFKVDESIAGEIVESYNNYPFKHFNDDGTFNAKQYATDVFIKTNFAKIVNSAIEYGKQSALKQRANPDKNGVAGSASTPAVDNRSSNTKLSEAIEKDEVKVYGNDELPEDVRRILEQQIKNR